jgi:hypothetical protein
MALLPEHGRRPGLARGGRQRQKWLATVLLILQGCGQSKVDQLGSIARAYILGSNRGANVVPRQRDFSLVGVRVHICTISLSCKRDQPGGETLKITCFHHFLSPWQLHAKGTRRRDSEDHFVMLASKFSVGGCSCCERFLRCFGWVCLASCVMSSGRIWALAQDCP